LFVASFLADCFINKTPAICVDQQAVKRARNWMDKMCCRSDAAGMVTSKCSERKEDCQRDEEDEEKK
jgi:hypothetical protein